MKPASLKTFAAAALIANGVLHNFIAYAGGADALRIPLAVFGIAYFCLGFWVLFGGRTAVLSSLIVAATGLGLGGANYLQNGGPSALPIMFLIDVLVLVSGGLWLRAQPRRRRA